MGAGMGLMSTFSTDFNGRTALVTGAAGAIGKGIALGLARCGAGVFITDLRQEAVDAAIDDIAGAGGVCHGLSGDATNEAEAAKIVAAAADVFGQRIDFLVNAAGLVGQGRVEDISVGEWDAIFAVNCKGTFLFIKHVVPLMKAKRFGKIVNLSSKSGKTGSALMSHYSATKAAVIGFTQALAHELAGDGITVNCVCPGIVEDTPVWGQVVNGYVDTLKAAPEEIAATFTAKVPLGRLARVADVVAVTQFLFSEGGDYLTGQAVNVAGGREMH
jgi:NAD(P)-dependent dehydrogenase (short-subunit alcohol dehydrogenase family)